LGRLLLSFIFVHEGWSLIDSYGPVVAYMQKFGLSATLLPVLLLQLGGGLLVAAGLATRLAAVALAQFCTFTALFFHRQFAHGNQLFHFQKDLAIAADFLRWPSPGRRTGRSASTSVCLTTRDEAFFERSDFRCDWRRGVYICLNGKQLKTSGTVHDGRTLLYRDCNACPLRAKCCTREEARKTPRDFHEDARDVRGAR